MDHSASGITPKASVGLEILPIFAPAKAGCLTIVLDLYSRRVVSWDISNHPNCNLSTKALQRAVRVGSLFIH